MFLEKRIPIASKSRLLATSKESLYRPEIKRFQNRLISRYRKPKSTSVLLLLPCSAKKPYSFSKSHKLFRDQLFSSGNPFVFHEVILTSPLGLVPRELELVYPASCYDIPVIGVWDEDEKKMIRGLLSKYLNVNKYDKIILHLPKEIIEFIDVLLEKPVLTCVDHPTSNTSLTNLLKILKETAGSYDKIKSQSRIKDDIECFASYHFGRKIAKDLLKNCNVKGKYPYQKIMYNSIQLGMITLERGRISLTNQGAERLVSSKKYWVEIYDDFKLKGSVFSPGVKNTDENIRVGDEVIVLQKGKLQAVGVALMNGEEMKESSYGEAVKIRHIV
jgi:archaeosine synthase